MQDYRININYAKALFLLSGESQEQEVVADDMRLVNVVCAENRELNAIFRNPEIKVDKKMAIVTDIFAEKVCKTTMAFLLFVVRKKRSVSLKGISASYLDLYRDSRGIVFSQFTTSHQADEPTCALASKVIADYTHKKVELVTKTNPKIIGGFTIEFDNTMYDASISTYLVKLRQEFDENVYEKKL